MGWPLKSGLFLCFLNIFEVQFRHRQEYLCQNLTAASSLLIYVILGRNVATCLIMLAYSIFATCSVRLLLRCLFPPLHTGGPNGSQKRAVVSDTYLVLNLRPRRLSTKTQGTRKPPSYPCKLSPIHPFS